MFRRKVEMIRDFIVIHLLNNRLPDNVLIRQIMFNDCEDDCRDCIFEDWCLAETVKYVK